ncbi:MAG: hypothetical protein ABSG36_16435 [Acidimicrobiales bacterium]|jgi:hypothetical protein
MARELLAGRHNVWSHRRSIRGITVGFYAGQRLQAPGNLATEQLNGRSVRLFRLQLSKSRASKFCS